LLRVIINVLDSIFKWNKRVENIKYWKSEMLKKTTLKRCRNEFGMTLSESSMTIYEFEL